MSSLWFHLNNERQDALTRTSNGYRCETGNSTLCVSMLSVKTRWQERRPVSLPFRVSYRRAAECHSIVVHNNHKENPSPYILAGVAENIALLPHTFQTNKVNFSGMRSNNLWPERITKTAGAPPRKTPPSYLEKRPEA